MLNKLTERLMKEGYSKEAYPDYVKEYNAFYGGFIYTPDYIKGMRFQTGCGIEMSGGDVIGTMSFLGQDWFYENDNPVIVCPYNREGCPKNHELLKKPAKSGLYFCACHAVSQTEVPAATTLDQVLAEKEVSRKESLRRYKRDHAERFCLNHMDYFPETNSWKLIFKPRKCEHCEVNQCTLFGYKLSPQKGNIYYDCEVVTVNDETVFLDSREILLFKGIPVLREDVSITICEMIVEACAQEILETEFFHPYDIPKAVSFTNRNVRAAISCVRNMEEDLEDIKKGIHIIYCTEIMEAKAAEEEKKIKRNLNKKVVEEEAFVLQHGFDALKEYEKRRIRKVLSEERIEELLEEREYRANFLGEPEGVSSDRTKI